MADLPVEIIQDVQGNILGGFNKDHQVLVFLRFTDEQQARSWLQALTPEIADSEQVLKFNELFKLMRRRQSREGAVQATWINVAFTHPGLRALGVSDGDLQQFPVEFQQGMRARADQIGDVGENAPANWVAPLRDAEIHALLLLAADAQSDLDRELTRQLRDASDHAIDIVFIQEGEARRDQPGHEHFGFKDGVSQPGIRGVTPPNNPQDPNQGQPGQDLLFPGEFVLGLDAMKEPPEPAPPSGYQPQPQQGVSATPADFDNPGDPSPAAPAWTQHGSYLVFRRLRQDVPAFRTFVNDNANGLGMTPDLMGAKLVGRYASGAPLERTADEPAGLDTEAADPSIQNPSLLNDDKINNFEYGDDPDGEIVPRAAHIRKAYPRNEATIGGGEADTQTHRLLRRGIAFGASFVPSARPPSKRAGAVEYPHDRGLLFLCYQHSIAKQFEFVQRSWVNAANFPDPTRPDGQDPIIANDGAQGPFLLPGTQAGHIDLMQTWVRTTGGEYFFSPSLTALAQLSGQQ
jgi:Dyp-type peroxidase family